LLQKENIYPIDVRSGCVSLHILLFIIKSSIDTEGTCFTRYIERDILVQSQNNMILQDVKETNSVYIIGKKIKWQTWKVQLAVLQ
jgi:hypothetical protein